MKHDNKPVDISLVTKLAHLGWDVNGDRLESTRSMTREDAHHLQIEFQPVGNRVGLETVKFNGNCKLAMSKARAKKFFDEQGVTVTLTDPNATLAPHQRQRSR